ncbi:MAG: 4a-hydroxytetrahydrobiopterin dehydratase [Candidatus Nanohaloarchaea archaeon]|nr:4a-hydroxytetrahydrobiopterin dehydratase [Candidatus Nanohaloarchaea archaeon]
MAETLEMEEIIDRVAEHEGWEQEGAWLTKAFEFEDFSAAIDFVDDVAAVAEELDHHPHIVVRDHDEVVLSITSHDAGGLTETDFTFVDRVEALRSG